MTKPLFIKSGGKGRVKTISLNAFLARLIWMSVLPLMLFAVFLALSHVHMMQSQHDREAADLARNIAASIDQFITAQISALQILEGSSLLDVPSRIGEFYGEARGFFGIYGTHVILADMSKQMLINTRVPFGTVLPKLPEPKGHAAVPTVLSTGKPAVGDAFFGPVAQEPLVAIATPVVRNGRTVFFLLCIVETRRLQQRIDEVALPDGWFLEVRDGKGETMAQRPVSEIEEHGADVALPKRFVANSIESHWSVVLQVPPAVYAMPIIVSSLVLMAEILAATLASVLGGRWAGRRLADAVAGLAEMSAVAASGQAIDEIEAVRRLLNDTAEGRDAAELKRRESEQRLQQLFEIAPIPMCFIGKDEVFVNINASFRQVLGYDYEDLPNLAEWRRIAYPDPEYRSWVVRTWESAVQRARGTETGIEPIEYRVTCKDGRVLTMLISGTILGDNLLASFFDITERKVAEEALRNKEATLRGILDATRESIWQFSPEGVVLMANETAVRRFGKPAGELIGRRFNAILSEELAGSRLTRLRETVESGQPVDFEDQRNGISFHHTFYPVLDAKGEVSSVAAFSRDITKRKQARESLMASEQRLRMALHAAKAGTWEWDLRTDENFWSEELWSLYGMNSESCKPCYEPWCLMLHPDDRARTERSFREASQNGTKLNVEWRVRDLLGGERWLMSRGQPVLDEHGRAIRYIGIVMDITERKQAEMELHQSLREKVALLKEVHHRVKNNLQIVASLMNLQANRAVCREAVDVLNDTCNRVRSMALLHEVLYRFGNLAQINFAAYVRELLTQLLRSFGPAYARVKVENNVSPVGLTLEQALPCGLIINELVSNSFKHGFPDGRNGRVVVIFGPETGDRLVLSVQDDGVGLPQGFDLTGISTLGLKLVSNLASQLHGKFDFEHPHGDGVVFTVSFPAPGDSSLEVKS